MGQVSHRCWQRGSRLEAEIEGQKERRKQALIMANKTAAQNAENQIRRKEPVLGSARFLSSCCAEAGLPRSSAADTGAAEDIVNSPLLGGGSSTGATGTIEGGDQHEGDSSDRARDTSGAVEKD